MRRSGARARRRPRRARAPRRRACPLASVTVTRSRPWTTTCRSSAGSPWWNSDSPASRCRCSACASSACSTASSTPAKSGTSASVGLVTRAILERRRRHANVPRPAANGAAAQTPSSSVDGSGGGSASASARPAATSRSTPSRSASSSSSGTPSSASRSASRSTGSRSIVRRAQLGRDVGAVVVCRVTVDPQRDRLDRLGSEPGAGALDGGAHGVVGRDRVRPVDRLARDRPPAVDPLGEARVHGLAGERRRVREVVALEHEHGRHLPDTGEREALVRVADREAALADERQRDPRLAAAAEGERGAHRHRDEVAEHRHEREHATRRARRSGGSRRGLRSGRSRARGRCGTPRPRSRLARSGRPSSRLSGQTASPSRRASPAAAATAS